VRRRDDVQRVRQRRDVDEDGARDDADEHAEDCCCEGEVEPIRVVADVDEEVLIKNYYHLLSLLLLLYTIVLLEEVLHGVGDDGAAGVPVHSSRCEEALLAAGGGYGTAPACPYGITAAKEGGREAPYEAVSAAETAYWPKTTRTP